MPKTEILFQGIIDNNFHIDAIKNIAGIDQINELIFCVAFARSEGVDLVLNEINVDISKIQFYLGVRNGITSIQSVNTLLKKKIKTFCVDTGKSGVLFHPKIYLSSNNQTGYSIIGSANLTESGLARNIETSFLLEFDLTDQSDQQAFTLLKNSVIQLPNNHPNNVKEIHNQREIIQMLWDGILIDENIIVKNNPAQKKNPSKSKTTKPINSFRKNLPKKVKGFNKRTLKKIKNKGYTKSDGLILVWENNDLKERDLNIPKGSNTNPTGSMLFKKANMANIDQRHYFRDVVFDSLNWTVDPKIQHYERAFANFELEIQGVNYGNYRLKLSHNTNTSLKSYQQHQPMTSISWGKTKTLFAKEELLGEKLRLYKRINSDEDFKIEIG